MQTHQLPFAMDDDQKNKRPLEAQPTSTVTTISSRQDVVAGRESS
jgi:hypothetical protein